LTYVKSKSRDLRIGGNRLGKKKTDSTPPKNKSVEGYTGERVGQGHTLRGKQHKKIVKSPEGLEEGAKQWTGKLHLIITRRTRRIKPIS